MKTRLFMIVVIMATCIRMNAQTLADDYKGTSNSNPISANIFCADPTALEYNGRLYVYGSNDHQQFVANGKKGENTYGEIKSIVIFSTDDMVNWTFHGTIDTKRLCSGWNSSPWYVGYGVSWAPSVTWRHNDSTGKDEFFLYFCNSSHGVGVLTAESPIGPWKSPNKQLMITYDTPGANQQGTNANFDPGVVIDDNGVGWITFGGLGPSEIMPEAARIVKLKPSMTEVDSTAVKIPAPYHFEANELNVIGGKFVYTYCSNWAERKDSVWNAYTSEHGITVSKPNTCTMCYMVSDNPTNPNSWVYKGVYGPHPGMGTNNNHSHLQKFQGQYYHIYHGASLMESWRDASVIDNDCGIFRSICVNKATVNESTQTISQVTTNLTGVTQIKNLNPYELYQAETMASCGGVEYEDFTNIKKNTKISNLGNDASENMQINMKEGSWINVRKVDFGETGAAKFMLRAKGTATIELRTSRAGRPINTLEFSSTEMEEQTFEVDTTKFKGVKTNFLIAVTSATDFYVDAWQFVENKAAGGAVAEPYAVLTNDTLLTFYYDDQKEARNGMSVGPFTQDGGFQDWAGNKNTITSVVFDESFANCTTLTSTAYWFYQCMKLTTIEGIGNLRTDNVTDMNSMFWDCPELRGLDVSRFNTANVTNMSAMFGFCNALTSLDVSGFNTAKVTDMSYMFYQCKNVPELNVSQFKTDQVTDMSYMFYECSGLTNLDVSGFNTNNVTNVEYMFSDCTGLKMLDLSGFNTANVTQMRAMFRDCLQLTHIYVGNGWTTTTITNNTGNNMFLNCTNLVGGNGTTYDSNNVSYTYAHIDGGASNPGYFTELIRKSLTADDYFEWDGMGANARKVSETPYPNCNYVLGQSVGVPYGDPNVIAYAYADLSAYDRLEVTATAGTPRILFNRDTENGQWNATESQSHMIESDQTGWSSKYFSNSGNVWTVDLKQLVADKGFAHLNAIKGANWGNVTITKMELIKGDVAEVIPDTVETPTMEMNYFYGDLRMRTETDDAEIYYTISSRMLYENDTDFGYGNLYSYYNNGWSVKGDNSSYSLPYESYNGSHCLKLVSDKDSTFESAQASYTFSQFLKKGDYYTVYFKARSASGNGKMQFYCNNDTVANSRSVADTLTIGKEWADYVSTVKIENDSTNQFVLNFGAVADTYYIDNVQFGPVISDTTNQMRTRYEGTMSLRDDVTIKAVAVKQGMADSKPAILDYFYEGWNRLTFIYDWGRKTCDDVTGDPNVPLPMVEMTEKMLNDMINDVYSQAQYEHVDDTRLIDYEDMMVKMVASLEDVRRGFTVDGVSYHATDSTHAEVIAPLSYDKYKGVITIAKEVHYNDLDFQVTSVAQGAFANSQLTALFWNPNTLLSDDVLATIDNPNLLIYVNEASQAPERDNVIINGWAKNIRLTDAKEGFNDFYCPQAFTAEMVSYTRDFQQQTQVGVSRGWESIALPFNVQTITHEKQGVIAPFASSASSKHFWLRRLGDSGLTQATKMEANVPYIISMPNNPEYSSDYNLPGMVTFSAENVTIPVTEPVTLAKADSTIKMVPAFQSVGRSSNVWALNVGQSRGEYYEGSVFERDYREVRPFEAYTVHQSDSPAPRFVPIMDIGGTTGILTSHLSPLTSVEGVWYDLNGRKLQQKPTQKGVYLNNGRMVIIR